MNHKYIEKIDSFENETIYIKSCFAAMRTLAAKPNVVANTADEKSSVLERNYILSLVYNMGKADYLRENKDIVIDSGPYLVGGETNKLIPVLDASAKTTSKDLCFKIKDNKIEVIPDLVIYNSHRPEAGLSVEGQYLALEAKTSKHLGQYYFNRDFFKLNLYLDGLHFQNVVFMVINKSASTIDDYIGTYLKKDYYQYYDMKSKLRLFIQENGVPEMYKLK